MFRSTQGRLDKGPPLLFGLSCHREPNFDDCGFYRGFSQVKALVWTPLENLEIDLL